MNFFYSTHKTPTTIEECQELHRLYESHKDRKVKIVPNVKILPDTEIPKEFLVSGFDIRLQWKAAGGVFGFSTYIIKGGPDDGKTVEVYRWRDKPSTDAAAIHFNGDRHEYESYLGYSSRPCIASASDGLHPVTVAFLVGHLQRDRIHAISEAIVRLYILADKLVNR